MSSFTKQKDNNDKSDNDDGNDKVAYFECGIYMRKAIQAYLILDCKNPTSEQLKKTHVIQSGELQKQPGKLKINK